MDAKNIVILTYGIDPDAPEAEGKFLQLTLRGREHLLFARRDLHRFHNQILAQFLEDQGIPHHWIMDQTLHVESSDVKIIGGGRYHADRKARTLELWDNSQAYGRFNERGLKEKIAAAESPWRGFSITIA
jgi:hypothetical protein